MFSAQQGIPLGSMEPELQKAPVVIPEKPKHKISVPIPGGSMFRKAETTK